MEYLLLLSIRDLVHQTVYYVLTHVLIDSSEEYGCINIKSPKDTEEGNNVLVIKILLSMPFCIEYEHIIPSKHNATKLCGNFHTHLNNFSFNNSLVILIKNLRKYNTHH